MKCNPWLVLAAAGSMQLATAGSVGVITKCGAPGQVALIIDGLTQSNGPSVLLSLKEQQLPALATFSQDMLVGQDNFTLLDSVKKAGVDLGYRVTIENLDKFSDEKLVEELKDVTSRFSDIHQVKLAYVLFPYVESSSMQNRFAKIAKDAGLTAVAHSLYLGSQGVHAKNVIDKDLYHHSGRAYIALLEGHATDMTSTLKYYSERVKSNNFKAVSMGSCLAGVKELSGKRLNKHHHHKSSATKKKAGVPSHLIKGAARRNGAESTHQKTPKRGQRKQNKGQILVDPKLVRGFVQKKSSDKKKNGHHDKDADPALKKMQQDVQKMHAKAGKDFDLANADAVEVKDDNNNNHKDAIAKKDEVKQQAAGKEATAKKSGNGSGHLNVGTTSTMVIAAVVGLLAFL